MPDNRKRLTRRNPERDIAQHPIFVGGFCDVSIAEPHIAKLNFASRSGQTLRVRRGFNGHRLVEQLENSFAGGHCRLQNVEFLAQVLNRPEESLRVHRECGQHSQGECSAQNAHAAGPEDQGDRGETQKFYSGIEQCVRKDRVTPGKHVVAVAAFEFRYCLWFAIEQLHHVHARNVFLQEGIDSRNRSADFTIGLAHEMSKYKSDDQDARQHGQRIECQPYVNPEKQDRHHDQ